ncbi:MAG: TlpA family protein disulfide reductase [Candidatus Marinimicrobia bacterium]|nr:TlpA family protein disulfide reductase [Candidatus Neomarinimicrobiota bacterium]
MNNKMLKFIIVGVMGVLGFILLFSQELKLNLSQKKALNKVLGDINKAPDFTLKTMHDSVYTLSELEDKVVLINFWATWCGPCRMEIPEFNEMHNKYHEQGFVILGISVSDNKKQLKNFAKSFAVDYPLLYGGTREMNKIMKDYGGVYAVPSSFLVGKNGSIVWSYPGAILKNYDPQTFATLLYEIEKELKVESADPVEE